MSERVAIIGLGYVGLPLAIALARHHDVRGYDVDRRRVEGLIDGIDATGEADEPLLTTTATFTADLTALADRSVFIITVPTPVDANRTPDLGPIKSACRAIASVVRPGALIVLESTVYPGVTEEIVGPEIAQHSGLVQGTDFFLGYSPERINPGDSDHRLETIVKVVAADTASSVTRMNAIYAPAIKAGLYEAASIRVAEAAKVIENTQRDLNIALMNELSIIFDRMGLRTADVLAAARTKWNFLPFTPGLVGGHCIGVDPYYLTAKAQQIGYDPQVILAGRRINDGMGGVVVTKTIQLLARGDKALRACRVGILGMTFKENVPDTRNSQVPGMAHDLADYGIDVVVCDPLVTPDDAATEYGLTLCALEDIGPLDALILAVPHRHFRTESPGPLLGLIRQGGALLDLKAAIQQDHGRPDITTWSL